MYRLIRDVHLLLGLFTCAFLLMYGLSAIQMSHNKWFDLKPAVSESSQTLAPGIKDARVVARLLMDAGVVRGEIGPIRITPQGLRVRIVRPGTIAEADYNPASGETRIKTSVAGFWGMLNRIHHVGGLHHEYGLLNVWGALVAAVSVFLIAIALTGIYLWFKIHTECRVGAVLLSVSLIYSLTLLVLVRMA